jgi:hypothetical protein
VVAGVGGQEGVGAELLEAHRTLALRLLFLARALLFLHLLRRFLSLCCQGKMRRRLSAKKRRATTARTALLCSPSICPLAFCCSRLSKRKGVFLLYWLDLLSTYQKIKIKK